MLTCAESWITLFLFDLIDIYSRYEGVLNYVADTNPHRKSDKIYSNYLNETYSIFCFDLFAVSRKYLWCYNLYKRPNKERDQLKYLHLIQSNIFVCRNKHMLLLNTHIFYIIDNRLVF